MLHLLFFIFVIFVVSRSGIGAVHLYTLTQQRPSQIHGSALFSCQSTPEAAQYMLEFRSWHFWQTHFEGWCKNKYQTHFATIHVYSVWVLQNEGPWRYQTDKSRCPSGNFMEIFWFWYLMIWSNALISPTKRHTLCSFRTKEDAKLCSVQSFYL